MLRAPQLKKTFTWLTILVSIGVVAVLRRPTRLAPTASESHQSTGKLQLIVPATSTNSHLCQLLFSAAILGYPAPILINWNATEDADDYVQHLAKVQGVLSYLQSLKQDQQDDLVLVLDGFDASFQLPPAILTERYHAVTSSLKQRDVTIFGSSRVAMHGIRNTVLFGPDKLCWPEDVKRPACWAVPDSNLPRNAFGPDTDHGITEHNRPRWLNSGTIMGPASEVKDVFAATFDAIQTQPGSNSDQLYFANLFAEQSYARGLLARHTTKHDIGSDAYIDSRGMPENDDRQIPEIKPGQRTEYSIGIDYSSTLFQTVAYYEDYIAWIQHNLTSHYTQVESRYVNPHHHFVMPADLAETHPILESRQLHEVGLSESFASWDRIPLATNTVTKEIPVVIHFTGKKGYRELWWPRNWFYPHARALLQYRQRQLTNLSDGDRSSSVRSGDDVVGAAQGAWTQNHDWIDLHDLCGKYEDSLLGTK